MRKFAVLLLAMVVTVALAPAASAQIQPGPNQFTLVDWGSFFTPNEETGPVDATPNPVIYWDGSMVQNAPVPDETLDRTVFRVTGLYVDNGMGYEQYFFGSPLETKILGLFYDLQVGAVRFFDMDTGMQVANDGTTNIHKVEVDLVDAGRFNDEGYTGGRVDIWTASPGVTFIADSMPATWGEGTGSFVGDPDGWSDAGNFDTYPDLTDAPGVAPLLSGTLVPNGSAANPLLTFELWVQDGPSGLTSEAAGNGKASAGNILVLSNQSGVDFVAQYGFDSSAQIVFQNTFSFYPKNGYNEPVYDNPNTDDIWWDTASNDPGNFDAIAIPEPTSLSLLGLGLIGAVIRRRKRS